MFSPLSYCRPAFAGSIRAAFAAALLVALAGPGNCEDGVKVVKDATDSTAIKPASKQSDGATDETPSETPKEQAAKQPPQLPPPAGATQFPGQKHVWINREKKTVYVDGQVSLRQGVLEMFACPKGTKEHESVVAVNARAKVLHAALLAVGAKSGTPVRFVDQYVPPTGDVIKITVQWLDQEGKKHSAPAQQWVRNVDTNKAMEIDWVFAGSGFWKDEETGKQIYMAEGGDLVCVANFSTAMLDVAAQSTQANEGLMFEAFTENVPALGTPVRLVMTAEVKKAEKKE